MSSCHFSSCVTSDIICFVTTQRAIFDPFFLFNNMQGSMVSFLLFYDSGYMSPEYAMQGIFSIKSDVYSFGVLLLEIIVGKKNGTYYHDGPSPYLNEHVSTCTCANNDYKIRHILFSLL